MKLITVITAVTLFGSSFSALASTPYHQKLLTNEVVIEKVYAERNKDIGLTKDAFKQALSRYYDYQADGINNSEAAQRAFKAANDALEKRKTNSDMAKQALTEYVKLQNVADLELANVLEIQVGTLQRFREAAAYVEYLHKNQK